MSLRSVACLASLLIAGACSAENVDYDTIQLSDEFYGEGAAFADFDGDGHVDIASGPYIYYGPDWKSNVVEVYEPKPFNPKGYSDNFFAFGDDINSDGKPDLLVIGFPGKAAYWFENTGRDGHWPRHLVLESVDNESPTFADINGDGTKELICAHNGFYGYAARSAQPEAAWEFRPITPQKNIHKFTHGLGVGDVSGDGRPDLLEKKGWWEQPASGTGRWTLHPYQFTNRGGAQMHAYDFDGDGDNDVLTGMHAHGYGLAWFEQFKEKGEIKFRKHLIMGESADERPFELSVSQLHAIELVDLDGDGLKDVITGKRWWAHGGKDIGADGPVLLVAMLTRRSDLGKVTFEPKQLDVGSGVGVQVQVGDVNDDDVPDVVVGSKKGTFVTISQTSTVESAHAFGRPEMVDRIVVDKAADHMSVPEGFRVQLAAAEPDVRQPIAMALDDRGRVWVAEAYEYPRRAKGDKGRDRILIFEDTDLDGTLDKRTIFYEGLNLVSGLEVGFGGVWVGAAPYFMFIPDADGDDVPDGEPEILLDGWAWQDTHETLNAFIWGPDGWLYGCHGVFTHSNVGKPGAADSERQRINCGVWRYHPTKHEFEVFAHGTSNPWGVDFNDRGHAFITACVIPHLYHVIQGARYQRQAGQHFNPYTYDDIKTIAKHRHWDGTNPWQSSRRGADEFGGGHAHAGAMLYLGGEWPEKYRNKLLMNNIHGARLNQDQLSRDGSGYVGNRCPDFLFANDKSSQIINMRYGPDGQMTMIDWYDIQQCHRVDISQHDRGNGRIFRVSYDNAKPIKIDLKDKSDLELVELQLHENDWFVRHARRLLQERGGNPEVHERLEEIALNHNDVTRRLRGLWASHVTGGLTDEIAEQALNDSDPAVRGWAIQLLMEDRQLSDAQLDIFVRMAKEDASQLVRLYLASAAGRMDMEQRVPLLWQLVKHSEDVGDHNLPLMYWYALEPVAGADHATGLEIAAGSPIPLLYEFAARRIAEGRQAESFAFLTGQILKTENTGRRRDLLDAMLLALRGVRSYEMPRDWVAVRETLRRSGEKTLQTPTRSLALRFGDKRVIGELHRLAKDSGAPDDRRREAIKALQAVREPGLPPILFELVQKGELRPAALRALAEYDREETPQVILNYFAEFDLESRRAAYSTLASRASYAHQLLDAAENGVLKISDIPADIVRQITNLGDKKLSDRIASVWGSVRSTPKEKQDQIRRLTRQQNAVYFEKPDLTLGRAVFVETCAQCHELFGTGGDIGPGITGANRGSLEYLLHNIVDPSAVMAKQYRPIVAVGVDGRVTTGLPVDETDVSLTLKTVDGKVVLSKDELEFWNRSDQSMMPENQLKNKSPEEVRSLLAYLQSLKQVPIKATPKVLPKFFNGEDLTGWIGNKEYWAVEDGEIVGRAPKMNHLEFLTSELTFGDFKLTVDVKLVENKGNSGIQFRSERLSNTEVHGYQADIGEGWWGKLYEEGGRKLLWEKSGEAFVKPGEWNEYTIEAVGDRVRTSINGHECVNLVDPEGRKEGQIALQLHVSGPTHVRYKNFRIELK
ncbi:PVC-type heme-binding CxxCH protein [Stratiformator vulcanicus]|uniref:FG-GAP repeat protein n=1 Tax=Stratiformator vulcanicus TaxID=2527980 RepID=A0A517QXH9_9PLAN|nr:PVC-type heme-binding CxxCH protein [Stratiformator vulcanicus]QDT36288.1 FG-GAP repeat protein [Stratiformator vulcanicus]